ncbi:ferredoxin--NADP reductase [Salinispora fenicalii]|uniref:ferredoxin--NADP reductase n=1 Tax=Salinispora fenicalii TaxID=1137263 RepID=UPI0004BC2489|nr:ferredoxin--NADP reductase [Salinispora fenicalii]
MYHRLRVADVIEETPDAHSLVLSVPPELATEFAYRPGQYLTLRVPHSQGIVARCYSLSSSPYTETDLKITVKRVPGGPASNWICDDIRAGASLELLPPAGSFTPDSLDDDLLLLAGGSGITPAMSIIKSVLAAGRGRVALLYANRDQNSVIFAAELAALSEQHPDRLSVTHWLDSERGTPDPATLAALISAYAGQEAYVCGPVPFVVVAHDTLQRAGVPTDRIRVERFEVEERSADDRDATLEVELDGQTHRLPWPAGARLLDVLIAAGLNAPFSCRQGHCGACACRLLDGQVDLVHNEILEEEDFAESYILACQAVARSDEVSVTYY